MKFAKIIDNIMHFCPRTGIDAQGRMHTNLPRYYERATDRDGYLEVVETDKPSGNYAPVYTEQNGKIVQSWEPVAESLSEPNPYQMRADIDYIAMMTNIDMKGIG